MLIRLLDWYTTYTFLWALPPNGIFPPAKFTLRPSLAFSYVGSVTARHLKGGRQPNFVHGKGMVLRNFRRVRHLFGWAAITLGIGAHSSSLINYDQKRGRATMHKAYRRPMGQVRMTRNKSGLITWMSLPTELRKKGEKKVVSDKDCVFDCSVLSGYNNDERQ